MHKSELCTRLHVNSVWLWMDFFVLQKRKSFLFPIIFSPRKTNDLRAFVWRLDHFASCTLFIWNSNKDSKRDAIITSKNIKYIYMFSLVFRVGMKEEIIIENAQSAATSLSMKLPKCDLLVKTRFQERCFYGSKSRQIIWKHLNCNLKDLLASTNL